MRATHCKTNIFLFVLLIEIEQKSCGFARNPIKFRRFVVLTVPTRVRKID